MLYSMVAAVDGSRPAIEFSIRPLFVSRSVGVSTGACFFFSSRRLNTRYWRDWSSDVCSSDLTGALPLLDTGDNNVLRGPTTASFYYPRLGAFPSDATSSRNPNGIPGVDVLLQATFVPAGTPEIGRASCRERV